VRHQKLPAAFWPGAGHPRADSATCDKPRGCAIVRQGAGHRRARWTSASNPSRPTFSRSRAKTRAIAVGFGVAPMRQGVVVSQFDCGERDRSGIACWPRACSSNSSSRASASAINSRKTDSTRASLTRLSSARIWITRGRNQIASWSIAIWRPLTCRMLTLVASKRQKDQARGPKGDRSLSGAPPHPRRGPAHRRHHRQAAAAAADLEVIDRHTWKLSQISEKARVKHDRIGAESRRLLRRGHLIRAPRTRRARGILMSDRDGRDRLRGRA
jgi:hypothetical protein